MDMDANVIKIRQAIAGRGSYLFYILQALKASGVDNCKEILCQAISEWGKSRAKKAPNASPAEFIGRLESGNPPEVYERKVLKRDDDLCLVEMRYCPLFAAWQDAGATKQEIKDLCDIACEGDYTVVGERLRLSFDSRLADGDERCLMRVVMR